MSSRDLIPQFAKDKIIKGTALEQLRIAATQQHGGTGAFVDSTGTYQRRVTRRERGIWFKPDTDVPAFGVMYATGIDDTQGELVIETKKPDGLALGEIILINGPEDVENGAYGKCRLAEDVPWQALVNGSETVAAGDVLGPKSSQWDLYKDFPGLIAFDAEDADDLAWVRLDPDPTMDIELKDALPSSGSVSAGQQATAYRLQSDGDVDTGTEVEAYDERGEFRGKAYVSGSDRGSKGVVYWHREKDRVAFRTLQPHALHILGTASDDVFFDDLTFRFNSTPTISSPTGALAMEDLAADDLIANTLGLQFASGDIVFAEWNEHDVQWEAIGPGVGRPHRISGVTGSEVTATTTQFTLSGTPAIMNPIGAISEEDYTAANLIKNPLGLVFASGDTINAEWNDATTQWEAVVPGGVGQARWLQFTASADFLTGGTITIDARTYFDGFAPGVAITSILNPLNLTGYDNVIGVAHINTNVTPPTYTAFNVAPVAEVFLTDFQVDTSTFKLQEKHRDISTMPRGDESDWTDIHTGDDCDEEQ